MRVLMDSCVSGRAVDVVRAAGHDVVWAGEWPEDPGDEQIFRVGVAESRVVVVTIDKDFGELAIVQGIAHFGLIRLVGFAPGSRGRPSCACWPPTKPN